MSFKVNWNTLETDSLREWTTQLLTDALNSGRRPPILASDIQIKDLNFGKVAPDFEILDIGELDLDRFRGIFKILYSGDFHLTLHTRVQANPLTIYQDQTAATDAGFVTPHFLLASEPFALPLDLKLSDIRILGIGIIVFSRSKGLTLVFRNDPLDSIKVSSTFDTVLVLAKFLQKQIETQVRDLFRETLPTLIHRLSLKYLSSDSSSFLDDLRPQLAAFREDSVSLVDINPDVAYSPENLARVLALFKSRETLRLSVPRLRHSLQRSRLDKFTNTHPSLVRCLHENLRLDGVAPYSNDVPVDLVSGSDFAKTNEVLQEISSIQANNYYRASGRPKRRVIKMKRRSEGSDAPQNPVTSLGRATASLSHTHSQPAGFAASSPVGLSSPIPEHETVAASPGRDENTPKAFDFHYVPYAHTPHLHHPKPRLADSAPIGRASGSVANVSTPLHANSSMVAGIGLGNNYFNFASQSQISMSPIRQSSHELEKQEARAPGKSGAEKTGKSNNHIDIAKLDTKLNAAIRSMPEIKSRLDEMPPPPYRV